MEERSRKTQKLIAQWIALSKRKDVKEPVRGYSTRYERTDMDHKRAAKEAAEATELARRFLKEPKNGR